jgi:hypothetical protein
MAGKGGRVFEVASSLPPTVDVADEPQQAAPPPEPAVQARPRREAKTPRRRDVTTSRRRDAEASEPPQRLAYTWRLTRDQADQLDRATAAVRDAAGRIRLDRAEMLTALLDQLDEDPSYAKKVARRLN